jgi:hypothetical protein
VDRRQVAEADPDALLFDGFDEAIVGIASRCGQPLVVVYSMAKMAGILQDRDGLGPEEAVEHLEFNVLGSWAGDRTPAVLLDLGQELAGGAGSGGLAQDLEHPG